jgi:hypothetical protein
MNTIFSIVKNPSFINDNKYKLFIESLNNLDGDTKVVILNSTSLDLNLKPNSRLEVLNVTPMNSDLNIYGAISGYLSNDKTSNDGYVLVVNIEHILFTRNPFSFLKHFKKDLYFYSLNHLSNESAQRKNEYVNFVKTCNFFMGNDYDSYSVGNHIFGGKMYAFKALLVTLFLEVNRNSAHLITSQSVLSYVHKHFFNLFDITMFNNQFCKVVESQMMAESAYKNDEESKKQYVIINL